MTFRIKLYYLSYHETSHKLFLNSLLDYLHEILVGYQYYSHHKCPHILLYLYNVQILNLHDTGNSHREHMGKMICYPISISIHNFYHCNSCCFCKIFFVNKYCFFFVYLKPVFLLGFFFISLISSSIFFCCSNH